jgi:hypothetical protein
MILGGGVGITKELRIARYMSFIWLAATGFSNCATRSGKYKCNKSQDLLF